MRKLPTRVCLVWMLLGLFVLPGGTALATETDFNSFFVTFQKAAAAGDKTALADLSEFQGFTWEADGGPIPSWDVFLKRFERLFTPAIKKAIAAAKPLKVDDDRYCVIWKGKGLEYSLYFIRRQDGGFAFLGLTAGPD